MSNQYHHPDEAPDDELLARVEQFVEAITEPSVDPLREFTMRIPAEYDRDADIFLRELARRYKASLKLRDPLFAAYTRMVSLLERALPKVESMQEYDLAEEIRDALEELGNA